MLTAVSRALAQMPSQPFRRVLFKSAGAALVLLILVGIGLQRLFAWLLRDGSAWLEATAGGYGGSINVLHWMLAALTSLGVIVGLIFLMPAVTALVASFFADEIAEHVERTDYPQEPVGTPLPVARSLLEGVKTAGLAVLVYLCALPFLLLAGLGAVIFFVATAWLLSREYFHLAAMRYHSPAEAKALRRRHAAAVFLAGLPIAGLVSIPIVNLATPLFATAVMVHLHKRLSPSPELTPQTAQLEAR
jgi:CysZ protein